MIRSDLGGWIKPTASQQLEVMKSLQIPIFADVHSSIYGNGRGKTVLLYDYFKKLTGYYAFKVQEGPDCVSFGASYAVDHTIAVDIVLKGDFEEWQGESSTETIYGGSRVNIGKGQLGNGGGSIGSWASKWLLEYGSIKRDKYQSYDLTKYNWSIAEKMGRPGVGVPKDLVDIASKHKIQTTSLVQTYEEARDLLSVGMPITIASNCGFSTKRDKDGFLSKYGSWAHQMCLLGVDDNSSRPGVLCQNSWPKGWVTGPTRLNQPEGSFWIDADVLERYILSANDSWAFSGFIGYPKRELNLRIV